MEQKVVIIGRGVGLIRMPGVKRARVMYLCPSCGHRFRAGPVHNTPEVAGRVRCPACQGLCSQADFTRKLPRGGRRQSGQSNGPTIASTGYPVGGVESPASPETLVVARAIDAPPDLANPAAEGSDGTTSRGDSQTEVGQDAAQSLSGAAGAAARCEAGDSMPNAPNVPAAAPGAAAAAVLVPDRPAVAATIAVDRDRYAREQAVVEAALGLARHYQGPYTPGLSARLRELCAAVATLDGQPSIS